jgi:signal transduction histidine kinase
MEIGRARLADAALYRKGESITAWARAFSVLFAALGLFFLWGSLLRARAILALLNGLAYIAFAFGARAWMRRHPESRRWLTVVHDVVDAVAVGAGAALSGGLESPVWLLLYAHVVAVSVRGGLGYAMAMGVLDALIVGGLTAITPSHPEGPLHTLALLFCAFTGGTTSSYVHQIQARLFAANRELKAMNDQLRETAALASRMENEAREHLGREKGAYQRLEDLDRLRTQYLNNVSHEFRTPLTVIRGYGEHLMNEGPPVDGSLPEVMRVIVESCDQIIDMVDTLIEVSRIEQEGESTLEVRLLNLHDLVESSVDPLRLRAAKKGVELTVDFPGEALRVSGDASLLDHLVRKLVDNAVKYSPPGGRVVVRGRSEAEAGTIEVEDAGIGISAEHIPHIFDKFYMVDGGLTRHRRGAGVGLYMAREIVRLHKGEIEVRSRPGEGTVFSVRLPRRPARPSASDDLA